MPAHLYDTVDRAAGNRKFVWNEAIASNGSGKELWVPPQTPFALGIALGPTSLVNGAGAAVKCGLAGRIPTSLWVAGQVTAAGAYTADTTDAQDEGTGDFSLHDRADSGSGFLVGCQIRFNILGIIQSAAGDQTGPTLIVEYYDGSSWINVAAGLLINDALIANSTGEKVLCWGIPVDWAVGGSGTGVPATTYNLRVRNTTTGAGTADPVASQLFVGHAKMINRNVPNGSSAGLVSDLEHRFPPQCDGLFPVFSTASWGNHVEALVRAV